MEKKLLYCGNKTYTFSFINIDGETLEKLEGATFELKDQDLVIATATSNEEGKVTFENIEPGQYILHETIPPGGYILNDEIFNVLVRGCNRTTINGVPYKNFSVKNIPVIFELEYNPNGIGTEEAVFYSVRSGDSVLLITNPFTSVSNDFLGWNTESDGSGTEYQPNVMVTMNSNMKLYARWKSRVPLVNSPNTNQTSLMGVGENSSLIAITFPNGDTVEEIVNGLWEISVPSTSLPLIAGQVIIVVQTEQNMEKSSEVNVYVSQA